MVRCPPAGKFLVVGFLSLTWHSLAFLPMTWMKTEYVGKSFKDICGGQHWRPFFPHMTAVMEIVNICTVYWGNPERLLTAKGDWPEMWLSQALLGWSKDWGDPYLKARGDQYQRHTQNLLTAHQLGSSGLKRGLWPEICLPSQPASPTWGSQGRKTNG